MIPFQYRCSECGRKFERNTVRYLCPDCSRDYRPGMPLKGVLLVEFDYERLRDEFDRKNPDWSLFLPVEKEYFPGLPVGATPFHAVPRLFGDRACPNVWLKNDGLNPSGSLKDRASWLMVAEAKRLGEKVVTAASTGNAGSALAAICAAEGLTARLFVPASAPAAKLLQSRLYGADLVEVQGTYDDAFRLSLEDTALHGGLNRNTAYHPLTIEGKKTAGLEIFAANTFHVPDVIFVPVGDGVILAGIWKGFYDLMKCGISGSMPRLIGVQADSSDAIANWLATGRYRDAADPATLADSISVRCPSNARLAVDILQQDGNDAITVSDEEISDAQLLLARRSGVFAEPAAAAAVAGMKKAIGQAMVDRDEQAVLLITGNGLKDVDGARRSLKARSLGYEEN